jgi:hypothetical protein
MKRLLVAGTLAGVPWWAAAHEGHGQTGFHWHATDVWGFIALAVVAGAALWFQGRK